MATDLRAKIDDSERWRLTCPRSFIQRRVESRRLIRPRAWGERQAIGGAGWGCAAGRVGIRTAGADALYPSDE